MQQGCGLFVNSGILHRYEAAESVSFPNIVFSPKLFGSEESTIFRKYVAPVADGSTAFVLFRPEVGWQKDVLQLLLRVFRLQEAPAPSELLTAAALLELWQQLCGHLRRQASPVPQDRKKLCRSRLQIMMQYIHANFYRPLSLKEIAASVYISESSALQLFHSGIRQSPVAYLIRYRLMQAAELLANTDKPVTEIAFETGFASAGYFCRKFKERYGCSPAQWRNRADSTRRELPHAERSV